MNAPRFPANVLGAAILKPALLTAALLGLGITGASPAWADDSGTTGSTGSTGTTGATGTTGTTAESSDSGTSFDNGYQGRGPAELAGEKGEGCALLEGSAAAVFLLGGLGVASRRRLHD